MRTVVALRRLAVSVASHLPGFARFGRMSVSSGEGRPAAARRSWLSVAAGAFGNAVLASGVCAAGAQSAFCDDVPAFSFRPLLAGRASLTESGFVVTRSLGTASFAPELRLPVEMVYRSASEESGMFGCGWSCPQLESSAKWEKDGLLWTTPWGERVKFFPKKQKQRRDAVKIAPIEAARKGRGLFAPYADWEADTPASDPASARDFTISGKNDLKGWSFAYSGGSLARVSTPNGTVVDFERGKGGELLAVSSRGVRFIELEYAGELVSSMRVNGAPVAFSYAKGRFDVLPKTLDGKASAAMVDFLASVRIASLEPEKFTYAKGYLASASRGDRTDKFVVQTETPDERKQNLKRPRADGPEGTVKRLRLPLHPHGRMVQPAVDSPARRRNLHQLRRRPLHRQTGIRRRRGLA